MKKRLRNDPDWWYPRPWAWIEHHEIDALNCSTATVLFYLASSCYLLESWKTKIEIFSNCIYKSYKTFHSWISKPSLFCSAVLLELNFLFLWSYLFQKPLPIFLVFFCLQRKKCFLLSEKIAHRLCIGLKTEKKLLGSISTPSNFLLSIEFIAIIKMGL